MLEPAMIWILVPAALRELHSRRRGCDGDQLALLCGALGRPAAAAARPRPGRHPAGRDVLVVAARRSNVPRRARRTARLSSGGSGRARARGAGLLQRDEREPVLPGLLFRLLLTGRRL